MYDWIRRGANYEICMEIIQRQFPIKTIDSNDPTEVFVQIDDKYEREYYKFLIKKGISGISSNLVKKIGNEKGRKDLKKMMDEIKSEPLAF